MQLILDLTLVKEIHILGSSSYYPTTMANMGFYHVSTPYQYNQYTDFILEVRQVPTFAAINAYNT